MDRKPKVMELIAKLRALAADSANENEAALAAERMQELIARHKLTSAELLELDCPYPSEVDIEELYTEPGRNFARWRLNLAHVVAHANNCYGLHTKGCLAIDDNDQLVELPAKMEIVGTAENVAACQYVFGYLRREIERLAKLANSSARMRGVQGGKRYINSFCVGAAVAISRRLYRHRNQVVSQERAMVLYDSELASAKAWAQDRMNISHADSIKPTISSHAGLRDGRVAGNNISLDTAGIGSLAIPQKELGGGRNDG